MEPFDPLIPALYEGKTHMLDAFERVGASFGHTKTEAREFFDMLPLDLRGASVAWSRMDEGWCYHFGDPYTGLPNNTIVIGTPQIPKVLLLYRTLVVVRRYLSEGDQRKICAQLGQRAKHADFLEEMAPLLRVREQAAIRYEVAGEAGRTIDFLITTPGIQPVLLEVKNRHKDLLHHLGHFASNEALGRAEDDIPPPEPKWLFQSVTDKFPSCLFETRAQGVWIHAGVAQVETKLRDYFSTLDAAKVHFAILSAGEDRAFVLARTPQVEAFVQGFFNLTHHAPSVR